MTRRINAPALRATLVPDDKSYHGPAEQLSQAVLPAALYDIARWLERPPEFSYELEFDGGVTVERLAQAQADVAELKAILTTSYADASKLLDAIRGEHYPTWTPPDPPKELRP